MKLNEHAMSEHLKAFGAAFVGAMLCVSMTALSTGSVVAHAEQGSGDEIAVLSAGTKKELVGYFATVTERIEIIDSDTSNKIYVYPGSYARNSAGEWVYVPEFTLDSASMSASVPVEGLAAVQARITVQSSPGASGSGIVWWTLYKIVPDTSDETKAMENKNTGTTSPETNRTPTIPDVDVPPTTTDTTEKPTVSAPDASVDPAPQDSATSKQDASEAESELLSLQCRESEAEAKIAELEAQGYEIVRIEKLPKWWR